jgi:hypothetical protein
MTGLAHYKGLERLQQKPARINIDLLQKGKINSFKCTVEAEATKNVLSKVRVLAQWGVDQKRRNTVRR